MRDQNFKYYTKPFDITKPPPKRTRGNKKQKRIEYDCRILEYRCNLLRKSCRIFSIGSDVAIKQIVKIAKLKTNLSTLFTKDCK